MADRVWLWRLALIGGSALFISGSALAIHAIKTAPPSARAAKGDKLPTVREIPLTRQVKTVRVAAADTPPTSPVDERELLEANQPPDSGVSPPAAAPGVPRPILADICARSGGTKQFTSHGRRWHCVYSRR
jgi:hypothetical protein